MFFKASCNIITIVLYLFLVSGCSSRHKLEVLPKFQQVSLPELNKKTTTYLGESLLSQALGAKGNSIKLGYSSGKYSKIKAGVYCQVSVGSKQYFNPDPRAVQLTSPNGHVHGTSSFVYYNKIKQTICPPSAGKPCYNSSEISITENKNGLCIAPNSFQQVIEYNGKSGSTLRFTYREFQDNRARNSFTTNFTMDLTEGDTITYKGARIKVDRATNNEIVYTLLKNFNSH